MVMAPPGASTVVVVGSWAYPTPAANTTNEATLHRSFIKSPFALSPRRGRIILRGSNGAIDTGGPRERSARAALACRVAERRDRRITYDSRSEANVCGRHSGEPGVPGHDGES